MADERRVFFPPELAAAALASAPSRALFTALGLPRGIDARALWERSFSGDAADVLDELALLGTQLGRDALVEGARDVGVQGAERWADEAALDLAARLLASRDENARVLERAHLRLGRTLPDRMAYELVGKEPRRVRSLDALSRDAGVVEDDQGIFHVAWPDGSVVRLDPGGARVTILPVRAIEVDAIAAAVGRAAHDDARWFDPARPAITLKPLQQLGAAGLGRAKLPRGITRVRVIACTHDDLGGHRTQVRGPDALAKVEDALRAGGYLVAATLRFDVEGAARPVDVVLEVPWRIGLRERRWEAEVRAALVALGIFQPGAIGDDVVTLAPWIHPEWRWAELLGKEAFARAAARGLFARVEGTRRVASAAMRRLGRSAVTFPLKHPDDRGKHYVVAEDWAIPSTTVSPEELVMWRLDLEALLASMREGLGLERAKKMELPEGVHLVGELRLASGSARVFYATRAFFSEEDRAKAGRAVVKSGRAVVLVPAGRPLGRDSAEIALTVPEQLGASSLRGRLEEIAEALGVVDEIDPWRFAPEDVDFVFDAAGERLWIRGVLMTHVRESGMKMLLALAKANGGYVASKDIEKAISPKRPSDGAAKQTAQKIPRWIEESFEAAGRPFPADLRKGGIVRWVKNKGWALVGKAIIR